jgi:hypothetical protein
MATTLTHSGDAYSWLVEYNNSIIHPFSSYGLYYPKDTDSSAVRWDLAGSDSLATYWFAIRQQYMAHPSLPVGENTLRRTNIVNESIAQNGLYDLTFSMIGQPCYWGSDLIAVSNESYPSSMTTDSTSSARFTFFNGGGAGVGAVGTDITLTTGDKIKFLMPSFTDHPYNYPMISDRVNVTWSTTNVTNIKVYAVGVDGTKVLITDNVQGTFRIPNGASSEWATSLAEDFGDLYIADTYSAVAGSDGSAAFVADEDRIASFELMPAFTCQYLEYDVTKTGVATIHHPTFYMAPLADAQVFHETGDLQAILFKSGPILRPGSQSYFNYLTDTILTTPTPIDLIDGAQTIGDGWSLENSYFKGVLASTNNLTRLGNEFVSGEEFAPGVSKHLWRYVDADGNYYVDSMSFWVNSDLGPKLIYYSTWRASAQNCYFLPTLQRKASLGWAEDTNYGMFRYTWATSKHPQIVPGIIQPQLKKAGVDTLTYASAPTGWSVGIFQGAVTNNEGYDWEFWWNSTHWFDMRAWRGQTAVLGLATATCKHPYIVEDSEGRLHVAYIKDGDVWYRRSDNSRSAGGWTFDQQITSRGDVRKVAFDYDAVYKRFELYFETT